MLWLWKPQVHTFMKAPATQILVESKVLFYPWLVKIEADSSVLLLQVHSTGLETPLRLNLGATGPLNTEHLNIACANGVITA